MEGLFYVFYTQEGIERVCGGWFNEAALIDFENRLNVKRTILKIYTAEEFMQD